MQKFHVHQKMFTNMQGEGAKWVRTLGKVGKGEHDLHNKKGENSHPLKTECKWHQHTFTSWKL